MSMAQTIPILVISLPRARVRREKISRHLDDLGLKYELVEGVDGRLLSEDELRRLGGEAGRFTPGYIGNYAAHMKAYERILASNAEAALILEDDARLDRRFAPIIRQGIPIGGFDILFLDCKHHNLAGPVFYDSSRATYLDHGFRFFPLSSGPFRAHALIVTADTARRRLATAFPMREHIDVYNHLPFECRFAAVLDPRGAYLSDDSLISFTEITDGGAIRPRWGRLRQTTIFRTYVTLREYVRGERWQNLRIARQWVREGKLPASGKWRPLADSQILDVGANALDQL